MATIFIMDAATKDRKLRDMNADELAQLAKDQAAAQAAAAAAAAKAEADAAATAASVAHAKSLGFTDAMIAVMYPNLAP